MKKKVKKLAGRKMTRQMLIGYGRGYRAGLKRANLVIESAKKYLQ